MKSLVESTLTIVFLLTSGERGFAAGSLQLTAVKESCRMSVTRKHGNNDKPQLSNISWILIGHRISPLGSG